MFNTIFCVLIIIIGFFIGSSYFNYCVCYDLEVFKDNTKEVFRNQDGEVLNPIERNGVVYLPIDGSGSYLDYMTIVDEKGVSLYEVESTAKNILADLDTETIYGEKIDASIFKENEYTVLFLWGTYCKSCEKVISDFITLNDYLKNNLDISIYSVVTDVEFRNGITPDGIEKINNGLQGFAVKNTLLVDKVIEKELIGASVSLPKFFIFDNSGNLIKIVDKNITSEQFEDLLDKIVG